MILVVGANGFLGRETVRQLLAAGERVRAAARVPDTVADLKEQGAEVVHADLGGPDNVTKREVVKLYERVLGRSASVRYVPVAAMRVLAPIVRPFRPVLSRLMEAAIFSDTTDQTFDVGLIPQQYRGSMTRVEDFIRMQTRASGPSSTT